MARNSFLADTLKTFLFSLSQGLSASAGARGRQGTNLGMGAALGAPFQLREMERTRMLQEEERRRAEEDRQRAIEAAKAAALRGDQDQAMQIIQALRGSENAPMQVNAPVATPSPIGTMGGGTYQPPMQGGGPMNVPNTMQPNPSINIPGTPVSVSPPTSRDLENQRMRETWAQAQMQAQLRPPALFNTPGGTLNMSNPSGGFIPGTEPPAASDTTGWTAENVMVDGKEARVLRKGMDYIDANTKSPVTGRITPYNPPPTPRARGEITPTAEAGLITSLNNQWQKATKDLQELYRANSIMDSGMDAARRGDMNSGSQAVLITFQKFLDPTSVVRESEYARSAQGLAIADRIRGWYEKNALTGGAGVPLAELEAFAKIAKDINSKLANESNSLMAAEKRRIGAVAGRYNIPQEMVFSGYNFAAPGVTPTPAPGGTVTVVSPDGKSERQVPSSEVQYWISKGAKVKP